MDYSPPGSSVHGISGKHTGVGCHFLLQGIFPAQGSNPHFLYCRQILYHWVTREAAMPVWLHLNLIISSKTLFPNRVTFCGSRLNKSFGDIIPFSIKLAIFVFLPPTFSIVWGTIFVIKYFQTIYIGKDTGNSHRRCRNNEANRLAGGAPTRGLGFLTWAAHWNHSRFLLLLPDISCF